MLTETQKVWRGGRSHPQQDEKFFTMVDSEQEATHRMYGGCGEKVGNFEGAVYARTFKVTKKWARYTAHGVCWTAVYPIGFFGELEKQLSGNP